MTTTQAVPDPTTLAFDRARALARAIGESAAFRAFEAAQDGLNADTALRERLSAFEVRQQELRLAGTWGGTDPGEEQALEKEWEDLASHPTLAAHIAAREDLLALMREVTAAISDGLGVDFGAACRPAAGCC